MHKYGQEEACYGLIHLDTMKSVLFIPKLSEELKMWMTIHDPEYFIKTLDIDNCFYNDYLEEYLEKSKTQKIYLHYGENTDSGRFPSLPE